jgi:hypothetical protein
MKKCINELDALNQINKKLHSIFLILVCGLVIAILAINKLAGELMDIHDAVRPPHPMQPLHGEIDEPSAALSPSRPDDE